jgi:hypothetical protein
MKVRNAIDGTAQRSATHPPHSQQSPARQKSDEIASNQEK